MKKHHISFKHAWDGIYYNLITQPNFRIHLLSAIIVIFFALYLSVKPLEWLILTFTITLVITAEMINTAIESMVDLLSPERQKNAKIAKDTSAGMVLVTAFTSLIVALVIFIPYLLPTIN